MIEGHCPEGLDTFSKDEEGSEMAINPAGHVSQACEHIDSEEVHPAWELSGWRILLLVLGTHALACAHDVALQPREKVASSEWFKVFRWIDGQSDWEQPRHINHGLDRLRDMDVGQANDILNDPEWLKFVVVREPAERLLSCFLQKCNRWTWKNEYGNCPYLELWPDLFQGEGFPKPLPRRPDDKTHDAAMLVVDDLGRMNLFPKYVEAITRRVQESPCSQNPHWSPQWCHCSLDATFPVFTIVGLRNMSDGAIPAIVSAASSSQRGREIAEFIGDRIRKNHERNGKRTYARSTSEKAYKDDMLEAVREAYAKDYELFSTYWN